MKKQQTNYTMLFCSNEQRVVPHKVYWDSELQGLKPRYYARFLCGHCQYGLIIAKNKAGKFH